MGPRGKIIAFVSTDENAIHRAHEIGVGIRKWRVDSHDQSSGYTVSIKAIQIVAHMRFQSTMWRMRDKKCHLVMERWLLQAVDFGVGDCTYQPVSSTGIPALLPAASQEV